MSIIAKRELQQYGFRTRNEYDLALKMLKSFKNDEFKTLSLSQEVGPEPPVFACRFCKVFSYEHILALANEDGKIAIQNTNTSNTDQSSNMISCTQGHMNAIFDLAWSPHSLRLVSVSGDHTAILWDVSGCSLVPLCIFEGHSRSVKVAAFHPTDINVFATGARDGMVIMWDYRCIQPNASTIKPDNVIYNAHCQSGSSVKKTKRREPSRADSITGLVYQDDNHLISCSAGDGIIKIWDTRKCYSMYRRVPLPCYSLPHPGGSSKTAFTSLSVDSGGVRLYANCMDNHIYCYNIATYQGQPVAKYVGHQNQTFYIKSCLSGDGQYLVSGSSDEKAYIWSVRRPGSPLAALVGHTAEVTCVDWAENIDGNIKMVTCADDSCHRLWSVRPPTDSDSDNTDLVGWLEWLHKSSSTTSLTPRAIKRMVSRQERTPGYIDDTKRQKMEIMSPIEEGPERQILVSVQPRTEGKGARRLFDIDNSSHCTGVEILSPTSNLPNYVIEGTSPYHRCCSSASKQKENWLVKLQATPSPKQSEKITTKRKSQITPKVCRGNLLKFFKVAAKPTPASVPNSCEVQKEASLVTESPTPVS